MRRSVIKIFNIVLIKCKILLRFPLISGVKRLVEGVLRGSTKLVGVAAGNVELI